MTLLAPIIKFCSQPVSGLVTVPEQVRFALMSTWVVTHPPVMWSLNPLCMNESQNSLPWVEVFCAKVVGIPKHRMIDNMTNVRSRFMLVGITIIIKKV